MMQSIKYKNSGEWFKVKNILIDEYAKYLGPMTTSVYVAIKRYENADSNTAWPSEQRIAEKLNISRRTVNRSIKKLVAHRLITKKKERCKGQQWLHNKYYFLSVEKWSQFPIGDLTKKLSTESHISDKSNINQVTQDYTKKTNKKDNKLLAESKRNFKVSDYKPKCCDTKK